MTGPFPSGAHWEPTPAGDRVVLVGTLTAADLATVTSGDYEVLDLFFDRVMPPGRRAAKGTARSGGEIVGHAAGGETVRRFRQGEVISLEVADARRLLAAGAVRPVQDRPQQAAQTARSRYAAALAARQAD